MIPENAENRFKHYQPTCELRWNTMAVNPNGPNATVPWLGEPHCVRVLQQKWESGIEGEKPVWRPVMEFFKAEDYVP